MNKQELFNRLQRHRRDNNSSWVTLIRQAIEHDPVGASNAAREIIRGDVRIDSALQEIIDAYREEK